MKKLWKDFRTNLMYWRFRNITRNRLRLKAWWAKRRPVARAVPRPHYVPYRERGTASYVYRGSQRRSLTALLVMVGLLTALTAVAQHTYINPGIVYAIGALVVVAAVYWALRGV
ncbi:MAG TPA: hypothetical protein VKX16_09840 [Chloroflexota bacterium]|nr:hypothetical protein [Chloroflexota bacterium]